MRAEKQGQDKRIFAERMWLLYFNDVLLQNGIITADDYRKMILRINSRSKTKEQTKGGK